MKHLPQLGWADVATKRDLETHLELLEHRLMSAFRAELISQTRIMIFSMATAFVGVAGVTLAAVRLS